MLRNALIAAGLAAAVPAMAQYGGMQAPQTPWYFGFGAGQGHLGVSGEDLTGLNNASVGNTETTYTIRTGYRFAPYWALELGYYDLGKYDFHGSSGALNIDGEAKAKSVGLSLVGILPMNQFDLYGRIGYARSELKVNASSALTPTPVNAKDKQNEATYGVGGHWWWGPNGGVFVEWMKNDKIDIDSYLIGLDFRF
jgi:OOP family OmpA-OmpF porin